ncbi:MAG TPA: cupredoxin domain-containing protein [Mycobacteriales bacterium]|jgi:plastocyanin|nr:cupredoxin domain-containing protein [Mycobacteriales bacterium]
MRRRYLLLAPLALAAAALPAGASGATVQAVDNAFRPASLTVSVGDTVTWRNAGQSPHDVTASAFSSGNLDPGKSFTWTASKAGTFAYVCRYHESAGMKGTLVVKAAATKTTTTHPKTGGDRVALGLLLAGVAALAGTALRLGWRTR